ncbi:MAG: hypothetical protein N3A58_06685 [Spirochaetes bacterium]|nr:hypothetical protein [Spirochaetota bacterium]
MIKKVFFLLFFLFIFTFNLFALELKYYEYRDLRLLFNFYNEISEFNLYNYNFYYKVFFDGGKILKYEFYSYDNLDSVGEFLWQGNNSCNLTIKKMKTNISSGKPILKELYKYEITLSEGKIKEYVIYKFNETTGFVKVGISKFNYQSEFIISIENYFGSIYLGKIVVYFKSSSEKVQERIYDNANQMVEVRIFNNNALYQIKKYIYDKGKLVRIETYDAQGKLIQVENK